MDPGAFSGNVLSCCPYRGRYSYRGQCGPHTDKKENKIFLINKEILMGSGAKSYMRKDFPIYEEMRKFFTIYEEAVMS